jgi:ABC-type lipoprotein release transport system permease subunit
MSNLIYGVAATDPLTIAAVTVLLGLVALFASIIPAYRAARIDPLRALREE